MQDRIALFLVTLLTFRLKYVLPGQASGVFRQSDPFRICDLLVSDLTQIEDSCFDDLQLARVDEILGSPVRPKMAAILASGLVNKEPARYAQAVAEADKGIALDHDFAMGNRAQERTGVPYGTSTPSPSRKKEIYSGAKVRVA